MLSLVQRLAGEFGTDWRETSVLDDPARTVRLRILSCPAVVVNDRMVYAGGPNEERLRSALVAAVR